LTNQKPSKEIKFKLFLCKKKIKKKKNIIILKKLKLIIENKQIKKKKKGYKGKRKWKRKFQINNYFLILFIWSKFYSINKLE